MIEIPSQFLSVLYLLSLLAVPQLIGVLAYFRVRRLGDFPAHVLGFCLPPALSFLVCVAILRSSMSGDTDGCGMAAAATMVLIFLFTAVQMTLSLIIQIVWHAKHRSLLNLH